MALLEEKEKRKARRKLLGMYPDSGPLRRELYAKHLEFFAGGANNLERCMMAANRVGKCVTGDTVIETVDGERTARELWTAGRSFRVWAWNGTDKTQAVAWSPFKKAKLHRCYRVTMTDGRTFEGADLHRVLTSRGWRYLDELHQECVSGLPVSNEARAPSTRDANAGNFPEILRGLMGRYSEGFHRRDAQPRIFVGVDLASSPSQVDARQRSPAESYWGGLARRYTSTPSLSDAHLATLYAMGQVAVRYSASQDGIDSTIAELWSYSYQGDEQPPPESISLPQSSDEARLDGADIRHVPFETPDVDGTKIARIDFIGRHEVFDFHVPRYENYVTRGVVHHNTWGVGAFESTLHLTGRYPEWWTGRRFDRPIAAWVAGDTRTTTRDIVQQALLGIGGEGGAGELGTGMIPGEDIAGKPTPMQGVPGGVDTVLIRHQTGGRSLLQFKSYDQGRRTFQGTKKDLCWFDEEPPMEVYEEGLLRLTATAPGDENGLMLCTFTPLLGLSKVALKFLPHLAPEMTK